MNFPKTVCWPRSVPIELKAINFDKKLIRTMLSHILCTINVCLFKKWGLYMLFPRQKSFCLLLFPIHSAGAVHGISLNLFLTPKSSAFDQHCGTQRQGWWVAQSLQAGQATISSRGLMRTLAPTTSIAFGKPFSASVPDIYKVKMVTAFCVNNCYMHCFKCYYFIRPFFHSQLPNSQWETEAQSNTNCLMSSTMSQQN